MAVSPLERAVFFFPDGRARLGCVTLNAGRDPSGTQPVLFLASDSVMFYHGALKPRKPDVRAAVASLKRVSAIMFACLSELRIVGRLRPPTFPGGFIKGLFHRIKPVSPERVDPVLANHCGKIGKRDQQGR